MSNASFMHRFFFEQISAKGFSHMRVVWSAVLLITYIAQWNDLTVFYGGNELSLHILYATFLASLCATLIGWHTRTMIITSTVLLFWFHQQQTGILGGGDTIMRLIGFLLCVAPNSNLISVDQYRGRVPKATMPIWPWRLLLWQTISIYGMSLWTKLLGTTWITGEALVIALRNPEFARMPIILDVHPFIPLVLSISILVFEALWILLIVPQFVIDLLPSFFRTHSLRRWLIIIGIVFHTLILALFDVGIFSIAMLTLYVGLTRSGTSTKKTIHVLYDGHCGLCTKSMSILSSLDLWNRLTLIDMHDATARSAVAPNLSLKELDAALHISLPDSTYKQGFYAFRTLAWQLPLLLPIAPLLYLPGVPAIGCRIYADIAARRAKCSHTDCLH